jgi:hypothetical protein
VAAEVHAAFDNVCEALETAHLTVDEAFQCVAWHFTGLMAGGGG